MDINRKLHWRVIDVYYVDNYRLLLKFADGKAKIVDLKSEIWGELFEPLKDIEEFKKVRVEGSSIAWENGADFAPEFLYASGVEIEPENLPRSGSD